MTMNSESFVELDRSCTSIVKLGDRKLKEPLFLELGSLEKEPLLSTLKKVTKNLFMMFFLCQAYHKTFLVLVNCLEKVILYTLMMVCVLCMTRKTN